MTFADYPLNPAEARRIHQASLEILVEVGVKITHPEIRTLLLDAGAQEGKDSALGVPSALVEDMLQKAPRRVRLADLAGNISEIGCGAAPVFWSGNAMYYHREGVRQELARDTFVEFCRVANELPSGSSGMS